MLNNPQSLIDNAISLNIDQVMHDKLLIERYPKITVIVPSFNQGLFLEETLISIINQKYPNLELIVYDGGSKDNSVSILSKYDKYIDYWVSEKDDGQADAINKGLRKATGELIGWLNSDDLYLPECLFKVARAFIDSDYSDLIFGNCYLINENSKYTWELKYVPFSFEYLLYCGWNLSTQSIFWSNSIMKEVGEMKNLEIAFDYDWFLRICNKSKRIHFIKSPLGCYRIHNSSKFSMIKSEERIPIYADIRSNYINNLDLETELKSRFFNIRRKLYFKKFCLHIIQFDFEYLLKVLCKKVSFKSFLRLLNIY